MFKKKKRFIFIGIGILIGAGVLFMSKGRTPSVAVTKVPVESVAVKKTVSASGVVKSRNEADLSFATSGNIFTLNVKKGDAVIKGQLLAQLNAYTDSQTAKAAKDARDTAIRDKELYEEQNEDDSDTDEYAIALRRLDELISKAEASYQAALGTVSDSYIRAPFKGTVIDVLADQGETAVAGTTVVTVADLNQLVFEVQVDQEDFGYLTQSDKGQITFDSYKNSSDETVEGTLSNLPFYKSDEAEDTFDVELEIGTASYPVLLGMTGDIEIVIDETSSEVTALPFDAIFYDEDENPYVWIVENQLIKKLLVEVGLEGDLYTEIKNINVSEVIVSEIELKEGAKAVVND